ncbi:MAG: clostripain-related cysteine peptidase, partial [archaeon]|nr:clostripain-related cysteine peptidase [archaeon]
MKGDILSRHNLRFFIGVLIFSFIFMLVLALPVSGQQNYSVDAIAVWTHRTEDYRYEIWYSMYGHTPDIPKPVENITEWRWWNGTNPDQPASLLYAEGLPSPTGGEFNKQPDVSFDREGNAIAVWSRYYENIGFARWNGSAWSKGILPIPTVPPPKTYNDAKNSPTIAIDPSGNAIAVWSVKWGYTEDDEGYYGADLYYSIWNGTSWETPRLAYESKSEPNIDRYSEAPEIAFISTKSDSLKPKTVHKAVLVWRQDTVQHEPWSYTSKIYYSEWNGSAFSDGKIILGQTAERCGNPEISSNMRGNATVVWVAEDNALAAKWNGSGWEITNLRSNSYSPAVAYNYSDIGISVYQYAGNIWYSIEQDGSWVTGASVGSGGDYPAPKVACLAHNRTITVWNSNAEIYFSRIPVVTWEQQSIVPGGLSGYDTEVAIAAHTGSPTIPLAEWTYMAYLAADNSLHDEIINGDRSEMMSIGSTSLVNVINLVDGQAPFPAANTIYEYVKRGTATELKKFGDLNTGNSQLLEDFIAFAVEKYPANRSILDIADHGEGWQQECQDVAAGNNWMDMVEKKRALTNAGKKFNLLVFSECLMAQLEVAYQFREFGNFMVASEEGMPEPGPDYIKILVVFHHQLKFTPSRYDFN